MEGWGGGGGDGHEEGIEGLTWGVKSSCNIYYTYFLVL